MNYTPQTKNPIKIYIIPRKITTYQIPKTTSFIKHEPSKSPITMHTYDQLSYYDTPPLATNKEIVTTLKIQSLYPKSARFLILVISTCLLKHNYEAAPASISKTCISIDPSM